MSENMIISTRLEPRHRAVMNIAKRLMQADGYSKPSFNDIIKAGIDKISQDLNISIEDIRKELKEIEKAD